MPNQNAVIAHILAKGDVIWVPYRKDPLWPALVNNVYPKKVTYSFFPLSPGEEPKKSRFSCAPKLTYAFVSTETLPKNANPDLRKAYLAASEYLSEKGKTRGSAIKSLGESGVKEKTIKDTKKKNAKNVKAGKRKRNETQEKQENNDEGSSPPSKKATTSSTSSSSERSSPSGSHHQAPITDEQSKTMMNLIDDRLETLVNEIWKNKEVVDCQKQSMKDKMTIKLKNNQFLNESDYETVFERIVSIVRNRNRSLSLISAFNITASHIVPHVLITCYSTCKNLDYQTAKDIYHYQSTRVLGLDPSMSIPVTDHLEELCRLACDESDAIQK